MIPFIPVDELHARRQKLADLLPKSSLIILPAQPILLRNGDTEYPFRQESMFWYFTGINQPHALMILHKNSAGKTECRLWLEKVSSQMQLWNGARETPAQVAQKSGLRQVDFVTEKTNSIVSNLAAKSRSVWMTDSDSVTQTLAQTVPDMLKKHIQNSPIINGVLAELRIHKSDWEVQQLRAAAAVNVQAHSRLHDAISNRNPTHEYSLQAELEYVWRQHGLTWSYPPIVAAGAHATTLHYGSNSGVLTGTDVVLVDAGCEYNYYASDITRTIPISTASQAQQVIIEIVQKAHAAAFQILAQPDCTLMDVQKAATLSLIDGLVEHGVVTGSVSDMVNSQAYLEFWPHSIGHWLGLDIHDFGPYKNTEGDYFPLEKGMVFTIEPGLYIPKHSTTALAAFRGIGVRLEDNVVITEHGVENMTEALPLVYS